MKKPYIFQLEADYVYQAEFELGRPLFFKCDGKTWLGLSHDGRIIVAEGYSWDGCSPKVELFGKVFGTPDGGIHPQTLVPRTYYASLIHDALLQFSHDPRMPLSRADIDAIFYDILKRDGFRWAWLYYQAVKRLGGVYTWVWSRLQ